MAGGIAWRLAHDINSGYYRLGSRIELYTLHPEIPTLLAASGLAASGAKPKVSGAPRLYWTTFIRGVYRKSPRNRILVRSSLRIDGKVEQTRL